MVLTDLYFMLSPPWCMGSRLNNSTLSPIPGKVKSRPYIIESFRNAETRCRLPPVRQAPGRKSAVELEGRAEG